MKISLAAFRAPEPFKTADGKLPERLLVAPWGKVQTNKGPVEVNKETLKSFSAFQRKKRIDRPALDFEHNTVKKVEPCKVAAYGVAELVEGEGIYLTQLSWTPEGEEHAKGGHYPDISPAVWRDERGVVLGLHSAALCRHGEIEGLTLFSTETDMDYRAITITLLSALGAEITEDATDEQITAAVASLKDKADKGGKAPETEPAAMSAEEARDLRARLERIETAEAARQRAALVAGATAAGKVIPLSAEEIDRLPLELLGAMIEKLPEGQVPAGQSRVAGAREVRPVTLSASDRELCRLCGVSEEEFVKLNSNN